MELTISIDTPDVSDGIRAAMTESIKALIKGFGMEAHGTIIEACETGTANHVEGPVELTAAGYVPAPATDMAMTDLDAPPQIKSIKRMELTLSLSIFNSPDGRAEELFHRVINAIVPHPDSIIATELAGEMVTAIITDWKVML